MERKVFPEKISVTLSSISICVYIYKQTENYTSTTALKHPVKALLESRGKEEEVFFFAEAKPQASNSKQIPREEQGRCLGQCPGLPAGPGMAPKATPRGPRPARTPCPQPLLPPSLSSSITSSPPARGPLSPLTSDPFPSPRHHVLSPPRLRPHASPPSSPRPAALTLPGFQQHRVRHDVLDFHGRGLLPLRAAGAGAAPTASFAPSSSPATAAAPSLGSSGPAGPQHCARLFPITRCSPRHRAPPPRGRRRGAGSVRPPRPWLLRPPQAAPPPRHLPLTAAGTTNPSRQRAVRAGDTRGAARGPAGICSA